MFLPMTARKKIVGKPRGRAGGRKALPDGEARVFVSSSRVAPATAAALKGSGKGIGATLDDWWQEIDRARKLAVNDARDLAASMRKSPVIELPSDGPPP